MAIDDELLGVLYAAHDGEITVNSNFAREKVLFIAMAASMGLLSTKITRDVYGRLWKLTCGGHRFINETENETDGENT